MIGLNQWLVWRAEPKPDGRTDKIPLVSVTDPAGWTSYESAVARAAELGPAYGIGFVFTAADPYFFIDIDHCLGSDGQWSPIALDLLGRFGGAGVEISQSGAGLHIVGRYDAAVVAGPRKCNAPRNEFSLFTTDRFLALGQGFQLGNVDSDHTAALSKLVAEYLQLETRADGTEVEWTAEPDPEWRGPADDAELIRRALAARSAAGIFGGGVTFKELWEADADALGRKWPDEHGIRSYDESRADSALAQMLAFWTGNDCERIERLMRLSALARAKWDRDDYLPRTILGCVRRQDRVYQEREREPEASQAGTGAGYLFTEDQIKYFDRCVYVTEMHRIITPTGRALRPEQFKAAYGGHVFAMDRLNNKSTRNAWEAFTENRGYEFPKVDSLRFDPLSNPGEIGIDPLGNTYFNSFVPQWGRRSEDDAGPFLRHIHKLLPDEGDREILLSYLAALVQLAGVKFQWCVLLQGAQGNGKTMLWRILEYAIGQRYCHQVQPRDLENSFNAWILGKLLLGIEEIRVGAKRDLADAIKPLITNHRVAINQKGIDQYTGDNRANFLLFSNHKDAVLKTNNDRRYCVLYTAQQSAADLVRDGMDTAYFDKLFDWLDDGGLAAVAGYLSRRPVGVHVQGRAPVTTVTAEAIEASYSPAEQILVEAIEAEELGFRGDIVCVETARQHLARQGHRLAPRWVTEALQRIGYVHSPDFDRVRIDGIRRRIYVRAGSPVLASSPDEIRDIWTRCCCPSKDSPA